MWTGPDWKYPSAAEVKRILAEIKRTGRTSLTILEIGIVLEDEMSRWSEQDKRALREEMNWKMYPVKSKVTQ
jgi:hypothetical protein